MDSDLDSDLEAVDLDLDSDSAVAGLVTSLALHTTRPS